MIALLAVSALETLGWLGFRCGHYFLRRTDVGTDQAEKMWPCSHRYSRYWPNRRELPVGYAGARQMVQGRPPGLIALTTAP